MHTIKACKDNYFNGSHLVVLVTNNRLFPINARSFIGSVILIAVFIMNSET